MVDILSGALVRIGASEVKLSSRRSRHARVNPRPPETGRGLTSVMSIGSIMRCCLSQRKHTLCHYHNRHSVEQRQTTSHVQGYQNFPYLKSRPSDATMSSDQSNSSLIGGHAQFVKGAVEVRVPPSYE